MGQDKKVLWSRLIIFFVGFLLIYLILGPIISQLLRVDSHFNSEVTQVLVIIYGIWLGPKVAGQSVLQLSTTRDDFRRVFPLFLLTLVPMMTDFLFENVTYLEWSHFTAGLPEAIFAGVTEEFIMRGIILVALLKLLARTRHRTMLSIHISSIMFALAHLVNLLSSSASVSMTLGQVVYAYMLGVFLGILFVSSGSLALPIVSHILIDSTAFLEHNLSLTALLIFIVLYGIVPMVGGLLFIKKQPLSVKNVLKN